jgi:hypothetical protein
MELVIILLIAVEVVIVRILQWTAGTRLLTRNRHLFVMVLNYGK